MKGLKYHNFIALDFFDLSFHEFKVSFLARIEKLYPALIMFYKQLKR